MVESLPLELFIEILNNTNGCTIGKCRRVCKEWKTIIDSTEALWLNACEREFKHSSMIAKRKVGNDCSWYHIFKNLYTWSYSSSTLNTTIKKFCCADFFCFESRALDVNYSILPIRERKSVLLYDMNTFEHILKPLNPLSCLTKNCLKIANNDYATAVLTSSSLLIQKNIEKNSKTSCMFFNAHDFVLSNNLVYFFYNRDIFMCNLRSDNLCADLVLSCKMDIKEIQFNRKILTVFTKCGHFIVVKNDEISIIPLNCPPEWIKQIKHINAINHKNFVCYSRNLFKIETDNHQHLYLDFPQITALFFYADIVLIGTRSGEILLYKLSSQQKAVKPVFEKLAVLPDGQIAIHLDVYERKSGPLIIVATSTEVFLIEILFFPHETENKQDIHTHRKNMYERLMNIKTILYGKYS